MSKYDIVLANGRVIDPETFLDAKMHVGIKGDGIAAVSEAPLKGKEVIDVSGMIVAPGFIDMHMHGQDIAPQRMQAFDGVTTALELEYGSLPIGEFYANCEKEGRPINYGVSVAWGAARIVTFNPEAAVDGKPVPDLTFMAGAFGYSEWVNNVANEKQIDEILALVEQGLKEGGIGIGFVYGYAPGAGTKEMVALCQLAADYGVPTYTHVQNKQYRLLRQADRSGWVDRYAHAHLPHQQHELARHRQGGAAGSIRRRAGPSRVAGRVYVRCCGVRDRRRGVGSQGRPGAAGRGLVGLQARADRP
jgi:cytosine/adenosine deaminase-related metal-dependent hydrolase